MKIFIEESAWVALVSPDEKGHAQVQEFFKTILSEEYRLFTSNVMIGNAMSTLHRKHGAAISFQFLDILDDAHLGGYLRVLWVGRRTQKDATRLMKRHASLPLSLFDHANAILMDRRRIHAILTLKKQYESLGLKVFPESQD